MARSICIPKSSAPRHSGRASLLARREPTFMGVWKNVNAKVRRKHSWHFAYYFEAPSERADWQWYEAYLFRNEDRSKFGKQEFFGQSPTDRDFQKWAARVIQDEPFRQALLSDDPSLPKLWKKH